MLEISKDLSLLYKLTQPWNFLTPAFELRPIALDMIALMYKKEGFGLSANQVGLPYSFFCMRGQSADFFIINPRIVDAKGELVDDLEGCLSYPGLGIKQKRWLEVRLRFAGLDGQTRTQVFKGLTSRVVQHEMNHLEGVPWWHVSKLKFDIAKKKAHGRGWDYSHIPYKGI